MGRLLNLEMPREIPFHGERNGSCFRIERRQGHRLQLIRRRVHSLQSVIRLRRGLNSLQHVSCHRRRFFNDTATTEIYTIAYTLSLHDALPIY